jgi:hypothetical protein
MLGLSKYMYNEGFAYRLLPLKPDTTMNRDVAAIGAIETTNSLVMYNNIMNKFKWGNFKTAKYLDHESLTQFMPLIARVTLNLADNLVKEGHPDLAKNLLNKYDEVMPDIIPVQEIAVRKYYMAETAYKLGVTALGDKIVKQLEDYLTNSLDYNYALMKDNNLASQHEIQFGVSLLNGLVGVTKDNGRQSLSNTYKVKLDNYIKKFGINMQN